MGTKNLSWYSQSRMWEVETLRPGLCKYKRPAFQPAFASSKPDNYFLAGGAIASLVAFATRNFTTVLALIWIGSPVCGLRPMRALR